MKATQSATSRHYSKHSDGYVKFNFSVQQKMLCSDRVKVNFDMHRDNGKVTAFDGTSMLNRQDILKKYISLKGPALCATITLVNYDNLEYHAQAIANEAVKSIGNTIHVDMHNWTMLDIFIPILNILISILISIKRNHIFLIMS